MKNLIPAICTIGLLVGIYLIVNKPDTPTDDSTPPVVKPVVPDKTRPHIFKPRPKPDPKKQDDKKVTPKPGSIAPPPGNVQKSEPKYINVTLPCQCGDLQVYVPNTCNQLTKENYQVLVPALDGVYEWMRLHCRGSGKPVVGTYETAILDGCMLKVYEPGSAAQIGMYPDLATLLQSVYDAAKDTKGKVEAKPKQYTPVPKWDKITELPKTPACNCPGGCKQPPAAPADLTAPAPAAPAQAAPAAPAAQQEQGTTVIIRRRIRR